MVIINQVTRWTYNILRKSVTADVHDFVHGSYIPKSKKSSIDNRQGKIEITTRERKFRWTTSRDGPAKEYGQTGLLTGKLVEKERWTSYIIV